MRNRLDCWDNRRDDLGESGGGVFGQGYQLLFERDLQDLIHLFYEV